MRVLEIVFNPTLFALFGIYLDQESVAFTQMKKVKFCAKNTIIDEGAILIQDSLGGDVRIMIHYLKKPSTSLIPMGPRK